MSKPILCLDFDGVIHSYTSGWKGAGLIPDPPVPGAMAFILVAVNFFTVMIYSSRSCQNGGIGAMMGYTRDAMAEHLKTQAERPSHEDAQKAARDIIELEVKWPTEKPAAFVTIDDRALTFTGVWPDIEDLKEFKPWNKGGVQGFDWGALQALRKASP